MKREPNAIDVFAGSRVRLRRMMLSMSQEKLGESLGITFQQIQKYEKGINRISASRLQTIARVLQVPVSFFFEGAPGEPAPEGDAKETNDVLAFLTTSEGVALNTAFVHVRDPNLRRRVIDLVRGMAQESECEPA